jgi:hypothetical protein
MTALRKMVALKLAQSKLGWHSYLINHSGRPSAFVNMGLAPPKTAR